MIGFNGGLIGAARETSVNQSVPGVWTPREQLKAKRAGTWPVIINDPYFANVSLLLRGDGTNGSTAIVDGSSSPKTITTYGNAQISTAQSQYGGSSIYFDGAGDLLSAGASSDFVLGTADFTVECWARISSVAYATIVTMTDVGITTDEWLLGFSNTANQMSFAINSSGQAIVGANYSSYYNIWTHIAACRSGSTLRLFFNGVQQASVTNTTNFSANKTLFFGRRYTDLSTSVSNLNGYIDDFRITKGVARYTSNFTPPGAL